MATKSNMKNSLINKIMLGLLLIPLASCNNTNNNSTSKQDKNNSRLNRIADHLYEITYEEDFDYNKGQLTTNLDLGGCSGIQNGIYRGRNYDWNYTDSDLCIVHAKKTSNRKHSSVGVADLSFLESNNQYEQIPFVTIDGINDAGICIQVNVIPYGENGIINHSETKDDDLQGASLVRYILDNASNIEEAKSLIEQKDVYSEYYDLEELHWMITGKTSDTDSSLKTIVVERFNDGYHFTESFIDNKPIMTNFNVSNFDGTKDSVGMGFGYERYEILSKYFDQASSVMSTFDLMEKVFFSKLYDLYSDSFWYSEYALSNLSNYYSEEQLINLIGKDTYDFFINNYGAVYYVPSLWGETKAINGDILKTGIIAPVVQKAKENYEKQLKDGSLWITVETSVYDLENLTLDIAVRESQETYHFTIE